MLARFVVLALALAELRDLNRHRTGHRTTPLIQAGFYLPSEIAHSAHAALLAHLRRLLAEGGPDDARGAPA